MRKMQGKVDLLCFGEAFVQGFESLCWKYEVDCGMAVSLESPTMDMLREWTRRYRMGLLTGYIEKDGDHLYSSCVLMDDGAILHNFRRITKGWKYHWGTDDHYREGDAVRECLFRGRFVQLALCGDLWDEGWERFKTHGILIWPVYVEYTPEAWEQEEIAAYAEQASKIARDTLMVNPICRDPNNINVGGAFHFREGKVFSRLPFDREDILVVDVGSDA